MLNVFPQLLLPFFAPFVLRVGVAVIFLMWSWQALSGTRWKGLSQYVRIGGTVLSFIGAVFMLVGFLTQAAALVLLLVTLYLIVFEDKELLLKILLFFALISLILSGAGVLAFDIPL